MLSWSEHAERAERLLSMVEEHVSDTMEVRTLWALRAQGHAMLAQVLADHPVWQPGENRR